MQIGIDIGGSHIGVGLINGEKIISKKETDISFISKEDEDIKKDIINIIISSIDEILNKFNINIKRKADKFLFRIVKRKKFTDKFIKEKSINLIGIAIPGTIKDNKAYRINNLNIKEFDIIKELKKVYDVPMKIRNDGKCAALCEKKYGNMKEYKDGVFLCVGTGIGSGVILNNNLLESNKFIGFELGHMIIQKNGLQCVCGNKGCFEAYCSMKKLKKHIVEILDIGELSAKEINNFISKYIFNVKSEVKIDNNELNKLEIRIEKMNNKNEKIEKVKKLIDDYIENFIIGLNNIINIFEPEVICFGGSISYYENTIIKAINDKLKKDDLTFNRKVPKLVIAKYNNNAGMIGSII